MSKLRIQNRYGIVPNELLNDPTISLKAKGLFAYIQSKPEDWDFASERIALDHTDGRDSVRSAIKELEVKRYLKRDLVSAGRGKFDTDYILFDKPQQEEEQEDLSTTDFPSSKDLSTTDFTTTDFTTPINPSTNKERSTNQEIQKKNLFADFYKLYPKKEDRAYAEKLYNKLTESEKTLAHEALPKHIAFWRKKYGSPLKEKFPTQYVPNPATWINNKRWEDILDTNVQPVAKNAELWKQEEAKKREENARRIQEKKSIQEEAEKRKADEKNQRIDAFFLGLPKEYQEQIQKEAEKELSLGEEAKLKFPEQYRLMRLAKIRSIAAKVTTEAIQFSKPLQ